ncbi:MAG: biotin/lipoyl-containing protein [Sedimentibacter sp.]
MQTLTMPKMGITMSSATIVSWKKKVGEIVKQGETLYEIETEKSSIVVESPFTGTLKEIVIEEGSSANVDEVIGYIEE